jgi:hypothetical protein
MWWTSGERDDVFWRSSQSGGRATQRSKKGKTTFGSYGDIAAVDPIGSPLIRAFTIELKRGSTYSTPGDLLDFKDKNDAHPWAKCILQAKRSADQAGSMGWLMICKRDCRKVMVFIDTHFVRLLPPGTVFKAPAAHFKLKIAKQNFQFVGIPLDDFLKRVSPEQIKAIADEN